MILPQDETLEVVPYLPAEASLALFASGVFLVPAARWLARRLIPDEQRLGGTAVSWGAPELALVLAVWIFAVGVMPLFPGEGIVARLFKSTLTFALAAVAGVVACTRRDVGAFRTMGFGFTGNERAGVFGALAYVMLAPLVFGVAIAWPTVAEFFGRHIEAQEVLTEISALGGHDLVLAMVLSVVVVPFVEELLFRGFLQPVFVRRLGAVGGVVLTSIVFGLAHGTDASVPIIGLSLVLGWIQLRSGRLAGAWAAHGLHNGLTLAMTVSDW